MFRAYLNSRRIADEPFGLRRSLLQVCFSYKLDTFAYLGSVLMVQLRRHMTGSVRSIMLLENR